MTIMGFLFASLFVDMLHYIENEWLVIVDCIEKGTIPDLEITEHLRTVLEVSLSYCICRVWLTVL